MGEWKWIFEWGFSGIELEVLSGFLSECESESTYTCIKKRGLIDSF